MNDIPSQIGIIFYDDIQLRYHVKLFERLRDNKVYASPDEIEHSITVEFKTSSENLMKGNFLILEIDFVQQKLYIDSHNYDIFAVPKGMRVIDQNATADEISSLF